MKSLPKQQINDAVDLLKTISGSFRLEILCLLCHRGPMSVTEISQALNSEQSATSHQLAKLKSEHLLDSEKTGQIVMYKLAENQKAELTTKIIKDCGCIKP